MDKLELKEHVEKTFGSLNAFTEYATKNFPLTRTNIYKTLNHKNKTTGVNTLYYICKAAKYPLLKAVKEFI